MGFDYALVHLKYTIPPAILLTLLYRPLCTRLDVYKLVFLITIAVVSTIPWDSYLIRARIWSYPPHVILGPTLLDIPLEELFFFVIQTYTTSLLYLALSKPTFQPVFLRSDPPRPGLVRPLGGQWRRYRLLGQLTLVAIIAWACYAIAQRGHATYTGLILAWAGPFLLLLWTLAYQFLLALPLSNTALPVLLPTGYLWVVDTLALRRGTWAISPDTKYGLHLWAGLDLEEALFFLVTNMLIVFGLLAFDNALSILYTFPTLFPNPPVLPPPHTLFKALLISPGKYDHERLKGLQEAVDRLRRKSRSFYLASSTFEGQIRTDLLLLYSFCRVADDLVDNASSAKEANDWIVKLHAFLDLAYDQTKSTSTVSGFVCSEFPSEIHSALLQLPTEKLSREPLRDLLRGFDMDLAFNDKPPINSEADLNLYSERVAGTVAQMCIELIFHVYPSNASPKEKRRIIQAGNNMGVALQYVNIARDISMDASIGRVYLPHSWLSDASLSYASILENPHCSQVEELRSMLLSKAFQLYESSRNAIEQLPVQARGPIRVAVESYMEIGRVLGQPGYVVKAKRATVPKWRRLKVAWSALNM